MLRSPERLLLMVSLLLILSPLKIERGYAGIVAYALPLLLVVPLYLWRARRAQIGLPVMRPWPLLLAALTVWGVVTTAAVSPKTASDAMIWAWGAVLGLYVYGNYNGILSYRALSAFMLLAVFVEVVVGMAQWVTRTSIGAIPRYFGQTADIYQVADYESILRVVGTLDLKNGVATWFVAALPFLLDEIARPKFSRRSLWRWAVAALALASMLVVFLSFSRGNLGAAAVGLAAWLSLPALRGQPRRARNLALRRSLAVAAVGVALLVGLVTVYISTSNATLSQYAYSIVSRAMKTDESASGRFNNYAAASLTTLENPVVGLGFARGPQMWTAGMRSRFPTDTMEVHSLFLRIGVEMGLVGMLILLAVVTLPWLGFLLRRRRADAEDDVLVAATVGFYAASLVYAVAVHYAIWPLGLLLTAALAARDERDRRARWAGR